MVYKNNTYAALMMFLNLFIYLKQSTNCLTKSEQEECIWFKNHDELWKVIMLHYYYC